MTIRQKNIFLDSEGDAWFERNRVSNQSRNFAADDAVSILIKDLASQPNLSNGNPPKILEIGCGEGKRLAWLADKLGASVYGIDPSGKAVEAACKHDIVAVRGTADDLPFPDEEFDIVVFGFCLYLCDRKDLFRIAKEADRVLKADAWVVIQDFFATSPTQQEYHHRPGVYSYKMDYRSLFTWHPAYTCYFHKVDHHGQRDFTDDQNEWVGTSIIRKRLNGV